MLYPSIGQYTEAIKLATFVWKSKFSYLRSRIIVTTKTNTV